MEPVNGREAGHDIDPAFLRRWSPRAFTGEPIPDDVLMAMFEAARWAPSAFNIQPTRFVYARRDTEAWDRLFALLIPYNQDWVKTASALAFVVSDRFRRKPGAEPSANHSHSFDAGAAWLSLALQAQRLGWFAHGMTGFDHEGCYAALGVPQADYRVEAAVAIGRIGDPSQLPDHLAAREIPSQREPLEKLVFEGRLRSTP